MNRLTFLLVWLIIVPCHASTQPFQYQLSDGKTLEFQLDKSLLTNRKVEPRYNPDVAKQLLRNQLIRAAAAEPHPGVKIEISRPALPLEVKVTGQDPSQVAHWRQRLANVQQQAQQQFLESHHYQLHTDFRGKSWLLQDHRYYANAALTELPPVAHALMTLYGEQNIRLVATAITSWVQSIPYQDLADVRTSPATGYVSPVELLFANQGDCDSKAVLWASVMKLIFPKMDINIIYFDDHAIIAARIPAIRDEQTLDYKTMQLLLIDPTGPAQRPMGQLADHYRHKINNREFIQQPLF